MVDLMTVEWARPRRRSGGAEPYYFWRQAALEDQMQFAYTWADDPRGHFDKFRSVGTQGVLELLSEIAERRTTAFMNGMDPSSWQSHPPVPWIFDDTFDVVKHYPFHCGGWLGLLKIRFNPSQRIVTVDRPDPDGRVYYITWPPAPGRSFTAIYNWLTQSISMSARAFDAGNSWVPSDNMLLFLRGQKKTGGGLTSAGAAREGFESFALTIRAMVYENFDARGMNFYIRHLRGHGPSETGERHHHFNQMIEGSGEADAGDIRSTLDVALQQDLLGFPPAWGQTRTADWYGAIVDHLAHWRIGVGNHRPGLTWLSGELQRRIDQWGNDSILSTLGGTRETQRTIGLTMTETLSTTHTVAQEISTSISNAYRTATTETWTRSLEESLTRLNSLTTSTSSGTRNTRGSSYGSDTSVTIGGETGALEELLIGKITGEATETLKTQMTQQFEEHRSREESETSSTSTTSSSSRGYSLQQMRERSYALSQSFSQTVSEAVTRARSLAASSQSVIDMDGDRRAHATAVRDGLAEAKRAVDQALSGL